MAVGTDGRSPIRCEGNHLACRSAAGGSAIARVVKGDDRRIVGDDIAAVEGHVREKPGSQVSVQLDGGSRATGDSTDACVAEIQVVLEDATDVGRRIKTT
jgi:hypothetical protein